MTGGEDKLVMEMDKREEEFLQALSRVKGIVTAKSFLSRDQPKFLEIEKQAEEKGMMGLGKVINSGVLEVLNCDLVSVALTSMDFDWGDHSSLVLKKDGEVVGREIRDHNEIAELSKQDNVWFMHENFFIFKDRLNFPRDLVKSICHFEIPTLPFEWITKKDIKFQFKSIIYANPGTQADLYLKGQYFSDAEEKGLGTVLVGCRIFSETGCN